MQLSEYKNIYDNEQSHFYYVGYHQIIISLIKKYLKKNKQSKILDVGCGPGLLTKRLEKFGMVQGVDTSPEALKYARKRGLKVKQGSVLKLPFKENSFDLVVSIDVLCHKSIKSDPKALQEIYRVLKPNGLFIVKLPAFSILYGSHDRAVYTKRRYTKEDMTLLLNKTKLSPVKITYLGSFLFPPTLAKTILEKFINNRKTHSSVGKVWSPLNNFLIFLFSIEDKIIQIIDVPIGISVLAIAKKQIPS